MLLVAEKKNISTPKRPAKKLSSRSLIEVVPMKSVVPEKPKEFKGKTTKGVSEEMFIPVIPEINFEYDTRNLEKARLIQQILEFAR